VALWAFFLASLSLLWPALALSDGELARAREERAKFFLAENSQTLRASYRKLVTQFERAAAAQPREAVKAQANLEAAELSLLAFYRYKVAADAATAERLARAIVKSCRECPAAPMALVYLGRALVAQNHADEAYRELMKVELNYPAAPEIAAARELMSTLRAGGTPPPIPRPEPSLVSLAPPPAAATPVTPAAPAPPPRPAAATPTSAPPAAAPSPRADGLAQAYALTLEDHGDRTTVIAWMDRVTPYVYNLIPPAQSGGSYRVYVDLRETRQGRNLPGSLGEKTALVRLVKINQFDANTVRLVADLPEAYPYLPVFYDNPPRLVLEIAKTAASLPTRPDAPPQPRPTRPATAPPAPGPPESLARQLGLKIRSIVIDPGHGGKDSGATGFGLKEKDLALKAAKKLKAKIESRLGLKVILTRDSDKFVTLDRRPKIVQDNHGDLFISIHANANSLASAEGLETYLLNFGSDPSALTVAARENASSQKSMSQMADILDLIAKNTKVAESRVLAKSVHTGALSALRQKYATRDLGVKEAVFVVLVNVNVPAILIEMGFLSNKQEADRLGEDAYLDLLTDGIVDGLASYIGGLPH
jgi:N-acetylmuramoyl-L-alanine amidase